MQCSKLSAHDLLASVSALQALYAELIDDDRLEEWTKLFVEDCTYKVIARENADRGLELGTIFCTSRAMLADRIISLRRANVFPVHAYRHILSVPHIQGVEHNIVSAQANYLVLQTRNDGATTIYNAGKYVDRILWQDGQLRFQSRTAIYDTNRIDTLMVKPI